MIKSLPLIRGLTLMAAFLMLIPVPVRADDTPVVIELYTSRGCSSCPPADRILEELAMQDNIIALGCPVTYWDKPWHKTDLSRGFCDVRQHGYGKALGNKSIFTPQMIVNGTRSFTGSHRDKLEEALKAAKTRPVQTIGLEDKGGGVLLMILPTLPDDGYLSYRLWGFGYKKQWKEDVKGGENSGRTIIYANTARSFHNLGSWMGQAKTMTLRRPDEVIDGLVIFAQANGYGQIVAAGRLEF